MGFNSPRFMVNCPIILLNNQVIFTGGAVVNQLLESLPEQKHLEKDENLVCLFLGYSTYR